MDSWHIQSERHGCRFQESTIKCVCAVGKDCSPFQFGQHGRNDLFGCGSRHKHLGCDPGERCDIRTKFFSEEDQRRIALHDLSIANVHPCCFDDRAFVWIQSSRFEINHVVVIRGRVNRNHPPFPGGEAQRCRLWNRRISDLAFYINCEQTSVWTCVAQRKLESSCLAVHHLWLIRNNHNS